MGPFSEMQSKSLCGWHWVGGREQLQSSSIRAGRAKSFGLMMPRQYGHTMILFCITFTENGSRQAKLQEHEKNKAGVRCGTSAAVLWVTTMSA